MVTRRVKLPPTVPAALVAAIAATLTLLPACVYAEAPTPRARVVPFGFMGVLAGAPLGDAGYRRTDSELRAMASAGVESMRFAFYWREAQPDGPFVTHFERTDRIVAAAARAHVWVLPTVLGAPRWAREDRGELGSRPRNPEDYARFMGLLVARYGPEGTFWAENPSIPKRPIRAWQVWNEPDHRTFWHEQPYYRAYVETLAAARRAVLERDPGAKVVLAGLVGRSWAQLAVLYRLGARPHFDYAAIHPFTRLLPDVLRILRFNRTIMRRYGDAAKWMIATEVTWPSSKGRIRKPSAFDRTERNQATLLSALFRALAAERRALRLRSVYWATWMTPDRSRTDAFDYTGLNAQLSRERIRRKPAFFSYRATARALQGCSKSHLATRCR
jgi:polysaccharide biosynthesis protein PslG